jgi:hypothetical protein
MTPHNESRRTYKEAVVAYFKVLFRNVTGGSEKNNEIPQSR